LRNAGTRAILASKGKAETQLVIFIIGEGSPPKDDPIYRKPQSFAPRIRRFMRLMAKPTVPKRAGPLYGHRRDGTDARCGGRTAREADPVITPPWPGFDTTPSDAFGRRSGAVTVIDPRPVIDPWKQRGQRRLHGFWRLETGGSEDDGRLTASDSGASAIFGALA
jgi:hypothetical protein